MSKERTIEEKMRNATEELARCNPIMLMLDPQRAMVLLSQLQLSARHPGNVGTAGTVAREIAQQIEKGLGARPGSDLEFIIRAGWIDAPEGMPTAQAGDIPEIVPELKKGMQPLAKSCSRCLAQIDGEAGVGWYHFEQRARFTYCLSCTAASQQAAAAGESIQ